MASTELILMITRLVLGAAATFFAILLWSTTRDTAWMLVIMGTILKYGEIIFSTFGIFGLVPADVVLIPGILTVDNLLVNLPLVLYTAAFAIMVRRNRLR